MLVEKLQGIESEDWLVDMQKIENGVAALHSQLFMLVVA